MADMQAGIGPFPGMFLLAHGWQRSDRNGDDRRRRGRDVDDHASGRPGRCDQAQEVLHHHPRRLHGDRIRLHPAVAELLADNGVTGRDCCRRGGGRFGHHSRHGSSGRFQPTERTQPGAQSRRQHGGGRAIGAAWMAVRVHRRVLVGGPVRCALDGFRADDPECVDRRR